MAENLLALAVRPLDVATPLLQASRVRHAEMEQQKFKMETARVRFGEAAADVLSAPENQRSNIWSQRVDALFGEGHIPPQLHAQWRDNYSPLIAHQLVARAMPAKDFLAWRQQQEGMEADRKIGGQLAGIYGGLGASAGGAPGVSPMPSAREPAPSAPVTGQRPGGPVQSSATVVGDAEGERLGIYPPSTPDSGGPPLPQGTQPVQPPPTNLRSDTRLQQAVPFLLQVMSSRTISPGTKEAAKTLLEWARDDRKLTDEQREYAGYFDQEVRAGRTPKSFRESQLELKRAGATAITVDNRGENAFSQRFGQQQAERWSNYITEARSAEGRLIDIQNMRAISNRVGAPGAAATVMEALGPYATALGIPIENLSDVQAYTSIIQRMAPQMRVAGSGATSDLEFRGMLRSLPGLMQEPAARDATMNTMEAIVRHTIAEGEIASRLATNEINRTQAERELRSLGNPMARFNEWRRQNPELYSNALKEARTAAQRAGVPQAVQSLSPSEQLARAPNGATATIDGVPSIKRNGEWIPRDGQQQRQ